MSEVIPHIHIAVARVELDEKGEPRIVKGTNICVVCGDAIMEEL